MATPISKDLRERVVEAHLAGRGTYKHVAELFGIGEATVSRWLRRHREKGELTPDPPGGGYPPRISRDEYDTLRRLVAEKPDRTVLELRDEWEKRFRLKLSRSAMQRALLNAGLTWKKNGSDPPSRIARKSKNAARRSSR
jgi:transposase